MMKFLTIGAAMLALAACAAGPAAEPLSASGAETAQVHDVVLRGGMIYDGSGGAPYRGDVTIAGDRIAYVGRAYRGKAAQEVDASGLAVTPGFINMLSWATESLFTDPKGQSDIRQGVTLQVFGEGWSMGPLNPEMKRDATIRLGDGRRVPADWTTLGQYLESLERRGTAHNVASFVGATTLRIHEVGENDVAPTPAQLDRMRALVRQAMNEGAMGVGSALIYAPGSYAKTDELVALVSEAGKCGGMYTSHMRSEGDRLLEAIDEVIEIARRSGAPAEIYHLKMAGRGNWNKYDQAIARIEAARRSGVRMTADMYTYTAGAAALTAAMPTWVQEGGLAKWIERMKDPAIRTRLAAEMNAPGKDWENLFLGAGPDKMMFVSFQKEALRPYIGKTLAEVARLRGKSPAETAMDLVIEDESAVGTVYFMMNEDNVRKQIKLPWMSFGSDGSSQAPEGVFLQASEHPRSYGNFARLLGRYVRDEKLIPLQEAVRRLTSFPASNLGIKDRGALKPGMFADIAVFDPATIQDHATFEKPQRYATGMRHVFVNGTQVLRDGEHSGATPGRVVRGPGWKKCG